MDKKGFESDLEKYREGSDSKQKISKLFCLIPELRVLERLMEQPLGWRACESFSVNKY